MALLAVAALVFGYPRGGAYINDIVADSLAGDTGLMDASTATSGVTYDAEYKRLVFVDADVNEFAQMWSDNGNTNLFLITYGDASVLGDSSAAYLTNGSASASNIEPSGVAWSSFDKYTYIVNDVTGCLYRYDAPAYNTVVDSVIISTIQGGSGQDQYWNDLEGVTIDPRNGDIYIACGGGTAGDSTSILRLNNEMELLSHTMIEDDVAGTGDGLGITVAAEGIAFHPTRNTLFLAGTGNMIYEFDTTLTARARDECIDSSYTDHIWPLTTAIGPSGGNIDGLCFTQHWMDRGQVRLWLVSRGTKDATCEDGFVWKATIEDSTASTAYNAWTVGTGGDYADVEAALAVMTTVANYEGDSIRFLSNVTNSDIATRFEPSSNLDGIKVNGAGYSWALASTGIECVRINATNDDWEFYNFTITGGEPGGIVSDRGDGTAWEDVTFTTIADSLGLLLSSTGTDDQSLRDCTFNGAGDGCRKYAGLLTIDGCTFDGCEKGLELSGSGDPATATIDSCTFSDCDTGLEIDESTDVEISYCTFAAPSSASTTYGLYLTSSGDGVTALIHHNTWSGGSSGTTYNPIRINDNPTTAKIYLNTFSFSLDGGTNNNGIRIAGGDSIWIVKNDITAATDCKGLYLNGANCLKDSVIANDFYGAGILVDYTAIAGAHGILLANNGFPSDAVYWSAASTVGIISDSTWYLGSNYDNALSTWETLYGGRVYSWAVSEKEWGDWCTPGVDQYTGGPVSGKPQIGFDTGKLTIYELLDAVNSESLARSDTLDSSTWFRYPYPRLTAEKYQYEYMRDLWLQWDAADRKKTLWMPE